MMARSPRSSKAGYIDARPPTQLDNVLLQRTAGPYIRVIFNGASELCRPAYFRFAPLGGVRRRFRVAAFWRADLSALPPVFERRFIACPRRRPSGSGQRRGSVLIAGQQIRLLDFRSGSYATELFGTAADQCLLFPGSDRFADKSRMTRRAVFDYMRRSKSRTYSTTSSARSTYCDRLDDAAGGCLTSASSPLGRKPGR